MKKIVIGIIVAVVVAVGAFLLFGGKDSSKSTAVESATTTQQTNQNTSTPDTEQKSFSQSDVATHNTRSDCWTIINGNVYDITAYVPVHPGGVSEITRICGKDGTSLFTSNPQHDGRATNELSQLKIGVLN